MSQLIPAKGFFGVLTKDSIDWLHGAVEEVWDAYGDDGDELNDAGRKDEILSRIAGSATGWTRTKDAFGSKVHKEIEWGNGTYRLTVVITKNGELNLDIRRWIINDER
jgi:hypothetical protein